MVPEMVEAYARWWGVPVVCENTADCWVLRGAHNILRIVRQDSALIPQQISMVPVLCGEQQCSLPAPVFPVPALGDWNAIAQGDLLTFLAGQLWRAEELQESLRENARIGEGAGFLGDRYGFFDRPVVDLWMRAIFEYLQNNRLDVPQGWHGQAPRFWMSFDIDCLRKWKRLGVVKHFAKLPWALLRGQVKPWAHLAHEAMRSHFPHLDPWYTLPKMQAALQAFPGLRATFFWLGYHRDHKARRYDVRHPAYARWLSEFAKAGHQNGLHGSPLHATHLAALTLEKKRLEALSKQAITLHRQHYLRIEPGTTFRFLERMGIRFDSTMAFNNRTGFRCGSCIPLPWWDIREARMMNLVELPLCVGDWTLHDPENFDATKSLPLVQQMADWAKLAGGILSIDFHELYFAADYPGHADFFTQMIATLQQRGFKSWVPEESL